jgi:polar amino acid transport system ATP-binding protein
MKLQLIDVLKRFGSRTVLDRLSLDVGVSQVICLIGASGSGKSTLLRCINLLEPINDGMILLDGDDISEPGRDPDPVRRRIGIVFQSFNLFPHMTVAENIGLAPRKVLGVDKRAARATTSTLLDRLALADKADEYPDRLSGGQQQRVAIARALAMHPEVMLLDEITSALDPELVGEVLDVVRDLKRDGMTMLIATHEMSFAREIADEVCFLHEGRILDRRSSDDRATSAPASSCSGSPRRGACERATDSVAPWPSTPSLPPTALMRRSRPARGGLRSRSSPS